MRKRIALFVVGLAVVLGALFLYQALTGASFLSSRKAPPATMEAGGEEHPPTYEQRSPNGDLLYLLSAKHAAPLKDESGKALPGQYDLEEPRATYYTTDGYLLYIRADKGTVTINDRPTGSSAGASKGAGQSSGINDHFRGAHLSGHVILTYGPRESFTDASTDIKTGQYQVRFEKDLDLNYAESLVTSPGRVHLRADQDKMRFDGENLTIAFSRTEKKQQIELLRIEPTTGQDNYMLIRDVGKNGGLSLENATGRGGNAAPAEHVTQAAAAGSATEAPASTEEEAAATQESGKSKAFPPTTYKVSFGKDVTATLGKSNLTCAQLYVFFQANAPQAGKQAAAKAGDAAAPGDTGPATEPATRPVTQGTAPLKQAAPEDLEVRWTGPMEMRPSAADDIQLADRRDEAIEAVGTPQRPVLVHDETRTARAGILKYRKGTQDIELEPGNVGPVVVTDADPADPVHSIQRLTCLGLHFSNADNRVHLEAGHLEVPQSVLRHDVHATGAPLTMSWEKSLDLELVKGPAAKGAKENYTARRAVFAGRSSITNVDFHLESDALDILLAQGKGAGAGGAAKSTPVLEHLLATGNVQVKGASRTGAGIKDAENPDGIHADRLELMTTLGANGPVPARLLAEGNVMAWGYQVEEGTGGGGAKKGSVSKNTLYTPKFDAALAPKAKAEKGDASAMGRVDVTSFVASDGVIVQIDNANSPTVYAKGKTLTAHVDQANKAATAVLDGEQLADGTQQMAEVSQGERGDNQISGLRILLNEKDRGIHIPGPGMFHFVQAAQKAGQKAMPAVVTWTKSMDFDNKTLLAHFVGDIDAHLVDQTDQISKLTCHKMLDVQLTKDPAAAASGDPTALGHLHLGKVFASGNVTAQGTKLDAAGKVISGIYLTKTEALTYDEASKNLDIPGPGQLLLQDYTVDKTPKANNNDSRGDTVFTWDGSLTYNGPTGMIAFSKNVYMNHHPLKPIRLDDAAAPKKAGAAATAPTQQHIILTADSLVAKVSQSKGPEAGPTSASPLALGAGSRQTLDNVIARGHAVLSMEEEKLSAETLTFDKVKNIATAVGKDIDHPAEIFRPGEGITTADSIKWDLTKGKNAIEVTGGHGTVQQN